MINNKSTDKLASSESQKSRFNQLNLDENDEERDIEIDDKELLDTDELDSK
jgi:hypothetical protein